MTIQKVRPHWGAVLTAVLVAALLLAPAGPGLAVVAGLLVLVVSGVFQLVTLLGYVAGAMTPQDVLADDEDGDGNG
jgi:hypothetical protein